MPHNFQNVQVTTNSFVIQRNRFTNMKSVMFSPNVPEIKPPKRQRLVHHMQVANPGTFKSLALYDDGSLLYTSDEIPDAVFHVHDTNQQAPPDARGWYDIRLNRTAGKTITPSQFQSIIASSKLTPESASAATIMQLMLCQTHNQDQPGNKKAYFFEAGKMRVPRMPVELWHGYYQAVRPAPGKLLVTVDTTVAAMYMSGPLMEVCMAAVGGNDSRRLGPTTEKNKDFEVLKKLLKNRNIFTKTTGRRVKTVRGLHPGPVGDYQFEKNGVPTTIAQHYKQAHNIVLQHPYTIGIITSGKHLPPTIVPLELCTMIPGQPYKQKLPPDAGATVIAFSVLKPQERLNKITGSDNGVDSPVRSYGKSEFLAEAGVSINPTPMTVAGRLFEPMNLLYGNNQEVSVRDGAWNVLRVKFQTPTKIEKWGLINTVPGLPFPRVQGFMQMLAQCASSLGMGEGVLCCAHYVAINAFVEIGQPPNGSIVMGNPGAIKNAFDAVLAVLGPNPDMIVVVLPENAPDLRAEIKYTGDILLGIRTQCLRINKIPQDRNKASQYFNNVALKLNARMGGCNALVKTDLMRELSMSSTPFMIFGADVAHPAAKQTRPSVVSLVWSHDRYGASYAATTRVQESRTEIIVDLGEMFTRAVEMFGRKYRKTPGRIFFYRDGVSEGEFEAVKNTEVTALKTAIDEIWKRRGLTDPKPKITFLVVGKRHHVTFFPNGISQQALSDRNGNCRAGLVVDRDLSNPAFKDFYLQSHAAIKGTSRSAHYTVICDENFNEDLPKLQELSYALCHIYAKATRSVSIPAPVYYADLACARGRFHMEPGSDLDIDGSIGSGRASNFDLGAWKNAFGQVHANFAQVMYFL
ncbi:Argonaute-like protein [Mycena chlorophos]|uniref:Argonaute-like protein n=1 Tax=Mycena chlorophos TaxID=658473 RepID=A0A8H6WL12_MYCCL|nr:Argonaute-like protein [Mycena chlorophos]